MYELFSGHRPREVRSPALRRLRQRDRELRAPLTSLFARSRAHRPSGLWNPAGKSVRNRLAAGGRWIRTIGPATEKLPSGAPCGFRARLHQLGEALIPRGTKSSNPSPSRGESHKPRSIENAVTDMCEPVHTTLPPASMPDRAISGDVGRGPGPICSRLVAGGKWRSAPTSGPYPAGGSGADHS
jgi:hypothetical protein